MKEDNWKQEDFAAEKTQEERSVSSSIDVIYREKMKPRENHVLRNLRCLQNRVHNSNDKKKMTSFARFKVNQRKYFQVSNNRH